MNSFASSRAASLVTAMTLVAVTCFAILAAQASALSPSMPKYEGSGVFSLQVGKAGKVMKKAGVKVKRVAPARVGKAGKATLPVEALAIGSRNDTRLNGGIVLRKGKRSFRVDMLNVAMYKNRIIIGGRVKAPQSKGVMMTNVFKVTGKPVVSATGDVTTIRIRNGGLSFAGGTADTVRKSLSLKMAPRGVIGKFNLFAKRTVFPVPTNPCLTDPTGPGCPPVPLVDPYVTQCGVEATSQLEGNLPAAAPLPPLAGAKDAAGSPALSWGFKSSFRSYIIFGATGSLQAVSPATVQAGVPVSTGFDFPVSGGKYAANNAIDTSDDQAIVSGTGTSLFCATGHGFRVAISNPAVVIDGENSRLVADVDTNLTGVWTPSQRIDIATLDLSNISPFYNKSGSEVTWSDIPVTMTQAGGDAICGTGEQVACSYTEGTELDPIDVAVKTPYDTSDLTALADYVESELPFPITDPIQGGCTLPDPADGNRTIDAAQAANPTANPAWKPNAGSAPAVPDLSGAIAVAGGGLDWGVRSGLRGTINGSGEFNLLGTTASAAYIGNGPGGTPRTGPGAGAMSGPGKFFTWPASASGGFYDPSGDGRLVLKTLGRVAFCQTQSMQVYGTVFSNPTVIIDGEDSRITVDVATRYRLSWVRGTVDIASLDLAAVTPVSVDDSGTTTVSWAIPDAGPVELTADGEAVLNMLSKGTYVAGALLDGATIRASFPTPVE